MSGPSNANLVLETSTTTGTGTYTLAGALTGHQSFSVFGDANTCYYVARDVDGSGVPSGGWEVGLGTVGGSGTTLARTTVLKSTNANAAVSWSAGTRRISQILPADAVSEFALTLLDDTTAAGMRATLELTKGTHIRECLAADRTYYVRTDGSDGNNGLANTSGGAFLTIQKAINVIVGTLDLCGYNVTVQVADGTYTGTTAMTSPQTGAGTITIKGNSGTPANVLISVTANNAFQASNGAKFTVQDLKIAVTTSGFALNASAFGSLNYGNINFGACASHAVRADYGGLITCDSNYTISGANNYHFVVATGGRIRCQTKTITLTGTPSFSGAFAFGQLGGLLVANGNTFSGSGTGVRYISQENSILYVAGAASTYFPGDSAGSTATGGLYV